MRNLYLNKAYKKGNRRAGCLVCPRAAERNEYMARVCYPNEFDSLMNNIREVYAHNFQSEKKLDEFIRNGGWKARKNGRDLPFELNYKEKSDARSFYRNLLGGLYRENPVKSRNYEAVKSSKKWENVGNSYIIPALLLYRYSYI